MKKNKEHKKETKPAHSVETPNPPQVMDPSTHPSMMERNENEKPDRKATKSGSSSDQKKKSEEQKLAPAEEL